MSHSTGSPAPNFFFYEIAGFETSPRPYLLKHGVPFCHSDVIGRQPFANEKMREDILFIASFFESSSHETFVQENRWFGGGLPYNQSNTNARVPLLRTFFWQWLGVTRARDPQLFPAVIGLRFLRCATIGVHHFFSNNTPQFGSLRPLSKS